MNVQESMREGKTDDIKDRTEEYECGGMMVGPYVRGSSEQLRRLGAKHSFRTVLNLKTKEIRKRAQEPLKLGRQL